MEYFMVGFKREIFPFGPKLLDISCKEASLRRGGDLSPKMWHPNHKPAITYISICQLDKF